MRRNIGEKKKKEDSRGCLSYEVELSQVLCHFCCKCGVMGPEPGDESVAMTCVGVNVLGESLWRCSSCYSDSEEFEEIKMRLGAEIHRLKGSEYSIVNNVTRDKQILTPTCMAESFGNIVEDAPPTLSTVVLLPATPSSLKAIMTMCEQAEADKTDLKQLVEELLKRPFVTAFEDTFACLYQSLLASIRNSMKRIHIGLSAVMRGEVLSLNPNRTSATKRTPNLGMTMAGALREVCCWSAPSEDERSAESRARSNINGRVKLYLKGTLVNYFEDEELNRIILVACKAFVNHRVDTIEQIQTDPGVETFISKITPIILKYLRIKVKLFVKHILAPAFQHYDLRLKFSPDKLKVELEGFVYAQQFNEANQTISRNPEARMLPDVLNKVLKHGEVLPTATLDWEDLSNQYNIEEVIYLEHTVGQYCQNKIIRLWMAHERVFLAGEGQEYCSSCS